MILCDYYLLFVEVALYNRHTSLERIFMARPRLDRTHEELVQDRATQLSKLSGNGKKTKIELLSMAEQDIKLNTLLTDLEISSQFEDTDEKMRAEELARKYFNDYTFEFISDKNTLKQLIFLEILNDRIQKSLNEFYKDAQSVPVQMMEGLHKNLVQITELKKMLGLTKADTANQGTDALSALELLKKKFKIWRTQNQGGRTLICPHCSKMVMLKIKTDAWEAMKHPWFIDRVLGNKPLFKLWEDGKITQQDVADVLYTSYDFPAWVRKKLEPNKTIKDVQSTTTNTAGDTTTTILPTLDPNTILIPSVFQVDDKMEQKLLDKQNKTLDKQSSV